MWASDGGGSLNEVAFVAPLGALVVVGLLYLRRVNEVGTAACWGLAWLALYGAGLVTAWASAPLAILALANVLSGLFSGLQLSGALVYQRPGPVARWPILAGLAVGTLSGALRVLGTTTAAWSVHRLEVGLLAAAVVVMWRRAAVPVPSGSGETMPVVLMGGRLDREGVRSPRGLRLLAKPFQPDELARAVREALDAAGAAARATRPRGPARRSRASAPPAGD